MTFTQPINRTGPQGPKGDTGDTGATGATGPAGLDYTADPELNALAGLTSAADRLPYFTGSGTAALATFPSYTRTIVASADADSLYANVGAPQIDTNTANTVKLVDGTNRQTLELYSYQSAADNLEGLRIKAVSSAPYEIGTFVGSTTGTNRALAIGAYERATPTVLTKWVEVSTAGNVGIGTGATISARTHVVSTTEQLRLGYDASNFLSTTVSSAGGVTFNATGASAGFTFSDAVTCSTSASVGTTLAVTGASTFTGACTLNSGANIRSGGLFHDQFGLVVDHRMRRAQGTVGAPTQVTVGAEIGRLTAQGYTDGNTYASTSYISFRAAENITTTASGGYVEIWTVPNGSTTAARRLRVSDNGNVGIGVGTDAQRLLELSAADSATMRITSTDTTASVGQLVGAVEFYGSDATSPGARVVGDIECKYILDTGATELLFSTNNAGTAAVGARLSKEGWFGVGTGHTDGGLTTPLDIAGDGLRVRTQRTPASGTAAGNAGEWCNDANYLYICTATNVWKRVALVAF